MLSNSDIISITGVALNFLLVCIAYVQLKGFRKSNQFQVIIDLDSRLAKRKAVWDSILLEAMVSNEFDKLGAKDICCFELKIAVAREDYINCLEMLALLILKGYLPNGQAKDQYQVLVCDIIGDHPEQFDEDSTYSSIKKLYRKWNKPNKPT